MKRSELEFAIFTASQIIRQESVLVIGSQSILGSFTETQLPERATMSQEVDIAPLSDDDEESLATRIDVIAGEWSEFDQLHGFYIQGVSVNTAYLPEGWSERVVTLSPPGHPHISGLCLEPHDLCAAKLARNDQKDREFVAALVEVGLVSTPTVADRIAVIDDQRFSKVQKDAALSFIRSLRFKP
jgi:hypothetical protein